MSRKLLTAGIAMFIVAACGGTNQTAGNSPEASSSPSAQPSPSAPSIANLDPCQLVTAQEASQLAGASYTTGTEETISSSSKMCVYGRQTLNVFTVEVAVAPDAATAQAAWANEEAQAQSELKKLAASEGASFTMQAGDVTLTGADKAAAGTGGGTIGGHKLNISAIYVLKGAVFFTFADLVLDKPAPTIAAMETQAATVLTRV